MCIKISRTVFDTPKDVVFTGCYVPPENSPYYDNLTMKDGVQALEECLMEVLGNEEHYMVLCGDLNARTGSSQPVMNDDSCDMVPFSFDAHDVMVDRRTKDIGVNNFGFSLLNLCIAVDGVILNGFCDDDRAGEFTYVSPHGSSLIDYFIVSEELLSRRLCLSVGDRIDSWHRPVFLAVSFKPSMVR